MMNEDDDGDTAYDQKRDDAMTREARKRGGLPPEGYTLEVDMDQDDLDALEHAYDVRFKGSLVTWGENKDEATANAWRHEEGEIGFDECVWDDIDAAYDALDALNAETSA